MSNNNASTVLDQLLDACKVISLDSKIAEWLGENDPKALVQVRRAIKRAQAIVGEDTGGLSINTMVSRQVAFRAVDEKFGSITEMTFVERHEEAAIIDAIGELASTLMVRGRERLSQRLGADTQRLISRYQMDTETNSTHTKGK